MAYHNAIPDWLNQSLSRYLEENSDSVNLEHNIWGSPTDVEISEEITIIQQSSQTNLQIQGEGLAEYQQHTNDEGLILTHNSKFSFKGIITINPRRQIIENAKVKCEINYNEE